MVDLLPLFIDHPSYMNKKEDMYYLAIVTLTGIPTVIVNISATAKLKRNILVGFFSVFDVEMATMVSIFPTKYQKRFYVILPFKV